MTSEDELRRIIDFDQRYSTTCGWSTPWGCRKRVSYPAHILMSARPPAWSGGPYDDGHVLFHAACSPAVVEPSAVRRWRGTWTARHEAESV